MFETPRELTKQIGQRIRQRRLLMGWTQMAAAARAGVAYRTWRRMEDEGKASIEEMVKAAVALRAEDALAGLFPEPVATSIDQLLEQQRNAKAGSRRRT